MLWRRDLRELTITQLVIGQLPGSLEGSEEQSEKLILAGIRGGALINICASRRFFFLGLSLIKPLDPIKLSLYHLLCLVQLRFLETILQPYRDC